MKEIWIGPQCLHLNHIKHLAYCGLCHKKCDCSQCTNPNCSCSCHSKYPIKNDLSHAILCPKLIPFWSYIQILTLKCSIILPQQHNLLIWTLITPHISGFQDQPYIKLWQQIYNIYIKLFYKN